MSLLFLRHPGEPDLALFAGGELGPLARWRIERHLSACEECREAVSEFFEVRSQVMDLGEMPAVEWGALAATIRARAAVERREPQRWLAARPAWALALALVALAVAGAYNLLQPAGGGVWLDASAQAVEVRVGDQQSLTLVSAPREETSVNWRVTADAASARYVDTNTGYITVNNVYAQ